LGSVNAYTYVGNDPINLLDPSGRFEVKSLLDALAATAIVDAIQGTKAFADRLISLGTAAAKNLVRQGLVALGVPDSVAAVGVGYAKDYVVVRCKGASVRAYELKSDRFKAL